MKKRILIGALAALVLFAVALGVSAQTHFTAPEGPSGASTASLDSKDHYVVKYAAAGLGAVTVNDYIDGRTYRTYSMHLRYTAGGTLATKVYVSNEDVASVSVTDWTDKSTELLGTAAATDNGVFAFVALYRWIKIESVLTGAGNALSYEILQGW